MVSTHMRHIIKRTRLDLALYYFVVFIHNVIAIRAAHMMIEEGEKMWIIHAGNSIVLTCVGPLSFTDVVFVV